MTKEELQESRMGSRIRLESTPGAHKRRRRVGRGAGSTFGSTCGRGDKGQNSRSGGGVRAGFEGGQMPIARRLPKRGFNSMTPHSCAEVRLRELNQFAGETVDLALLKSKGVVPVKALRAKVILSGELEQKVNLKGIAVSKGARAAIVAAQGTIED